MVDCMYNNSNNQDHNPARFFVNHSWKKGLGKTWSISSRNRRSVDQRPGDPGVAPDFAVPWAQLTQSQGIHDAGDRQK